ncbi:MAG TPA: CDP-alcohol phosphatidyltransferase family protein [Candidatus Bathyarchaeia archaeon]|nr:CDP-alcohol phosphatidyltransferase family protein [Candidatus Bathyarchaeia archaeon]
MLSKIQYLVEGHFQLAAGAFKKVGFNPNSITLIGFVLTIIASLFYSTGLGTVWLVSGTVLALLIGTYFDAIDGAMARRYHQISKMGGILDSVLDRVGETALFVGLFVGGLVPGWLSLWALSSSLMVSYVRARVDVEGVKLKGVGLAERPERLLILLIATILAIFNSLSIVFGVTLVALLSTITVVERLYRTGVVLSGSRRDSA